MLCNFCRKIKIKNFQKFEPILKNKDFIIVRGKNRKGGENMKKALAVILTLVFCFLMVIPAFATETAVTPRYNNVVKDNTRFYITSDGEAQVRLEFIGYEGITTGATITTKIQKKVLWWWNDVDGASWTDEVSGYEFSTTHYYNLSKSATYRLVYEYQIRGTGGATDVISGELEDKF